MDNIFDFNVHDLSLNRHASTDREFHEFVYQKLQEVLKREFPNEPNKQRIKRGVDNFSFACPYCGDSDFNSPKKRGYFIFKEGPFLNMFKCFKCGRYTSIDKFFREFNVDLPSGIEDYLFINKPVDASAVAGKDGEEFSNALFDTENAKKFAIPIDDFAKKFGLLRIGSEPQFHNKGYYYLIGRNQYTFYHFLYDPKSDSVVIMNLLDKDHFLGMQMRTLKHDPSRPKYMTVDLKTIHEKLLKDNAVIPEKLNSLSMIFNIYNVNVNRPILVTEGPLDAFLLPNCIATLGASKKLVVELPFWWVFDSDNAGNRQAINRLSSKEHVFMWSKLKETMKLPQRKKWDINDVVNWCIEKKINIPQWLNYFTDNPLDILAI